MSRRWLVVVAVPCVGCVLGAERRELPATAATATAPRREGSSAAQWLDGAPARSAQVVPSARPGRRWVGGYWHWDGVRRVWIDGHFEPERVDWSRR